MNFHITLTALFAYVLQSGLLLTVGLLAPLLLRLRHPKTLLVYWRALLPIVILLPLATATWQPRNPLPILSIDGSMVEEVVATTLNSTDIVQFSWWLLLVPVLMVTALGLTRIAIGLVYLARCRRVATPIIPLPAPVDALQRRLGLEVPFASTTGLSVPITFGWARPIVMVPTSFNRLSADEQEGVACHELLHVRRRDWPVALAEEVVRAVLWFHPAVWLLLPKIALCREQVVDAGTVDMTGKRRQYLDALWQIVVSSQSPAAALAVPLVGRSHLRARVESLKKEISMSKTRIIASVVVLIVAVFVAGYVGATVFSSAASTNAEKLSTNTTWSTQDDNPRSHDEKKKEPGSKLETWEHDRECGEITDPVAIEKVNPEYPEEARAGKITGDVVLKSTISEAGKVVDLEVLKSPDELLTTAAVDAVSKWRFEPARCDGEAVGVYYDITVRFALQ